MRDFTLEKYKELCEAINNCYTPVTVFSYIVADPKPEPLIIIRHDVDRAPENALKIAKLEHRIGIESTYYFRVKKGVFIPEIIREISHMGHEVGYHYEVVDKARGNLDLAIKIFEQELEKFRELVEVKTICMHGNPLTPWDNRMLWKKYDFRDYGIIGEAYLSIDYQNIIYLSDTGRNWSGQYSLKDYFKDRIDRTENRQDLRINSTDDVIKLINTKNFRRIYLLTHPNRWNDCVSGWIKELMLQTLKNVGKGFLKYARSTR